MKVSGSRRREVAELAGGWRHSARVGGGPKAPDRGQGQGGGQKAKENEKKKAL